MTVERTIELVHDAMDAGMTKQQILSMVEGLSYPRSKSLLIVALATITDTGIIRVPAIQTPVEDYLPRPC